MRARVTAAGWLICGLVAAQTAAQGGPDSPLFATSDACLACHNGLTTPGGLDVSIGADWRASMMANAARDPYWQAAVRRETIDHPVARAAIEDKCSTCHMPMARTEAAAAGGLGEIFAHLPVGAHAERASRLAADGVSCSACHQITDTGLGTEASFTGGFVVDTDRPEGERHVYGPFEVDEGRTRIMNSATGFVPTEATHLQSSELCGSCHTLYTHALDANGQEIGELAEQAPYLEWRHSAYPDEAQSCQSCHMPVVDDTPVSAVLGEPREGVSRHVFRGGNFFMLRMLNRYRDELGVTALPQELSTAAERTISHLETASARLALEDPAATDGRLRVTVAIDNLGGHKLPTAYPSRRVWLQLRVRAGERTIFESGAFQPDGTISGNVNDTDPASFEPHRLEITSDDQVQIYESVMVGEDGAVTTGLLTGVRYVKDNRLLPRGFDKGTADPDIAVLGAAADDPDFTGGSDRVRYLVDLGSATGPLTVEATLWYQPIGYRWAHNLGEYNAMETRRFVRYYESMADASAVALARATTTVP